ncbi:NAD(P)H-binding protein [Nocardia thailandica]
MRIVVAGGHGKIALRLARLLTAAGDQVHALVRDPAQAPDVQATGAVPVIYDLEHGSAADLAAAVAGSDAVVFAAGAGPGSGAARKYTVDRDGAIRLAEAAQSAEVRRIVQISTVGAGSPVPPDRDESWVAYIDAKTQAEDDLRARPLDWTILRPGALTDADGNGRVTLAAPPVPRSDVTRADVAAVVAAILPAHNTFQRVLELRDGPVPIPEAVAAVK